jgi:hypothetical protein
MTNDRMVKKLYHWKPMSTLLAGNPNILWENYLKEDLRITRINNWTKCAQNPVKWKEVFLKAKTIKKVVVAPDEAEDPWFESGAENLLFRQKFIIFFFSPPSTTSGVRIIIFFPSSPVFNRVKLFYVSFKFYFCASERFS